MTLPTSLNVGGIFGPSPKYTSSVAMILDAAEGWDEDTGDCSEYSSHVRAFYDVDVDWAYRIVNEFADDVAVYNPVIAWSEARQMIDIIESGCNWLVFTYSNGMVNAVCYESKQNAVDDFKLCEDAYIGWCQQEQESVCGSSYFNAEGEPLMTDAQARFENYLDDQPREREDY